MKVCQGPAPEGNRFQRGDKQVPEELQGVGEGEVIQAIGGGRSLNDWLSEYIFIYTEFSKQEYIHVFLRHRSHHFVSNMYLGFSLSHLDSQV